MFITKHSIKVFFLLTITSLLLYASNSAPISTTGAPGELTCAKSGCHSDNVVNIGNGKMSLEIENNISEYELGKTYKITINIFQDNINRYGFQFVALSDNNLKNAGSIDIIEPERTQILTAESELSGRKYITYRYAGTSATLEGNGRWTFYWTAPIENEGTISFYYAGISANNDGTDHGDFTYTKSFKINPKTITSIEENELNSQINFLVNYNQTEDKINVSYNLINSTNISFELFDLIGNNIASWSFEDTIGQNQHTLNLKNLIVNGLYFLRLQNGQSIISKKIFLNSIR